MKLCFYTGVYSSPEQLVTLWDEKRVRGRGQPSVKGLETLHHMVEFFTFQLSVLVVNSLDIWGCR